MSKRLVLLAFAVLLGGLIAPAAAEPALPLEPTAQALPSMAARALALGGLFSAEDDVEIEEIDIPSAAIADAAAVWPECAKGHWLNGPRRCTREHVDRVVGFHPCGKIQIGGRWYHIVYILWYEGGVIIGVRPTTPPLPTPTDPTEPSDPSGFDSSIFDPSAFFGR
jgi:hypothetical protein